VTRAVLALGSNEGDRLAALRGAVRELAATPGVAVVAVSPVYETDPVGGPDQPEYLNAVVVVESGLGPHELLQRALAVEQVFGRRRAVRWGPRTLDVDVITVGGLVLQEPAASPPLVLPHPRAAERAFVLLPWSAVDPAAALPGHGPVAELLATVGTAGVRRRDDLSLEQPG
jgi:2-amino-4-hydroxy-6-hydroxymethyldihydropteridine diphosphokinase